MKKMQFLARVVANEIDLNKLADDCSIPKKYTWEEPLILREGVLQAIIGEDCPADRAVFIFSFGSVVFVNIGQEGQEKIFSFIKRLEPKALVKENEMFVDDYELHIDPEAEKIELNDRFAVAPEYQPFYMELAADVIAKSVALEKIEERLSDITDTVEPLLDRMEKGKLRVGDKRIAVISSKIARYQYNTIAYIMILDKPDVTWVRNDAAEFYEMMSVFFELNDRYVTLKQKTELLSAVVEGISATSHTVKSVFVELLILVLILVEVVIMLIDLFM